MSSYTFGQVPSTEAAHAFVFHHRIAKNNTHIWPRSEEEIRRFAEAGQLFGARRSENSEFVALCYVAANQEEKEFELGGLITDETTRGLGIGTFLTRLAIAYTMAFERPWTYGQDLIAYVHEANDNPRHVLGRLGFEFFQSVSIPPNIAPASMERNSEGQMVGHKFRFTKAGLVQLSAWLRAFDGTLGHSDANAVFDLGYLTVAQLADALES